MKKIILSVFLVAMSVTLFACGDSYDFDNFSENDKVEMSSQEIATMLSEVDLETTNETMSMIMEGEIEIHTQSESNNEFFSSSNEMNMELSFSSETYMQMGDSASDVAVHSESSFEIDLEETSSYNDNEAVIDYSGGGDVNLYIKDSYMYLSPDVSMVSGGTTIAFEGQEKMSEPLPDEDFDEFLTDDILYEFFNVDFETDLDSILTDSEIAAFLDAFPMISVYEKKDITNVHFELSKSFYEEHEDDLMTYLEEQEDFSESDIVEFAEEMNDMMDSIDDMMVTYDIFLKEDAIVAYRMDVVFEMDFSEEGDEMSYDISFSIAVDYDAKLPKFPNDLDDYDIVDEFGENYSLDNLF